MIKSRFKEVALYFSRGFVDLWNKLSRGLVDLWNKLET